MKPNMCAGCDFDGIAPQMRFAIDHTQLPSVDYPYCGKLKLHKDSVSEVFRGYAECPYYLSGGMS